jgi:hypothetical protein
MAACVACLQQARRQAVTENGFETEHGCFGLVINDFRDYPGLSTEYIKDEKLLGTMHKVRAISKKVPAEVKQESEFWLAR